MSEFNGCQFVKILKEVSESRSREKIFQSNLAFFIFVLFYRPMAICNIEKRFPSLLIDVKIW